MSQSPNDGGPAFPEHPLEHDRYWYHGTRGMSLLDYFAGQALAGLIGQELSYERMAEVCYRQAEAMLSYKQNQQAVSESQQVALGIGGEK